METEVIFSSCFQNPCPLKSIVAEYLNFLIFAILRKGSIFQDSASGSPSFRILGDIKMRMIRPYFGVYHWEWDLVFSILNEFFRGVYFTHFQLRNIVYGHLSFPRVSLTFPCIIFIKYQDLLTWNPWRGFGDDYELLPSCSPCLIKAEINLWLYVCIFENTLSLNPDKRSWPKKKIKNNWYEFICILSKPV